MENAQAITVKETINREDEPADLRVTRFGLPDINDLGMWIVGRLRPKFPHFQDNQLIAMFRARVDSNECLFRRTKHAVAMAELVHETMSPDTRIVERFVLVKDPKYVSEAVQLYDEILRWANSIGAKEIAVCEFTDVPKADIQTKLGRLYVRETIVAKVGK